jgi:PST family polysaccharide transporter
MQRNEPANEVDVTAPTSGDVGADDADSAAPVEARSLITRGIVWNSAFQVFLVGTSFVSMLVLVRVLSPGEYGRAAAVTGILAMVNCFSCGAFIAQALQLRGNETTDWDAHWHAGTSIQVALCAVCNAIAAGAWLLPAYRPIAPVLHVASIGLLIDVPSQMANVRLRREMNFRSLRLTHAAATLVTVISSIALAFAGAGAYALIIGSNVLHGIPFGLYLLLVDRWRPNRWFSLADWNGYREPLRFGAQQSGSTLLAALRGALETIVIPPILGYEALGLLNRAQVLFTTTIGRVTSLVIETVYPMLPRSAGDPVQFARHATLLVQTLLLMAIPGAVLVGIEGPTLSRLLYGYKWTAADPLIWPGTIFAAAVATVAVFTAILQAQDRLRLAFLSSLFAASLSLPAIAVAAAGGGLVQYAWALAIAQCVAATIGLVLSSQFFERNVVRRLILAPFAAAGAGFALLSAMRHSFESSSLPLRAVTEACVFALGSLVVLRVFFAAELRELVLRLPGRAHIRRLLRLRA